MIHHRLWVFSLLRIKAPTTSCTTLWRKWSKHWCCWVICSLFRPWYITDFGCFHGSVWRHLQLPVPRSGRSGVSIDAVGLFTTLSRKWSKHWCCWVICSLFRPWYITDFGCFHCSVSRHLQLPVPRSGGSGVSIDVVGLFVRCFVHDTSPTLGVFTALYDGTYNFLHHALAEVE